MEIHFLNVGEGDCTIIEHDSKRVSMIDICCGNLDDSEPEKDAEATCEGLIDTKSATYSTKGNYGQKNHPDNPVDWLTAELARDKQFRFFRFICTHPDMDHIDGLKKLFETEEPSNFWDTNNQVEKKAGHDFGNYKKEDWLFYQKFRKTINQDLMGGVTVLRLHDNNCAQYYGNGGDSENDDGDRITIVSPSFKTEKDANKADSVNDISYVMLFKTASGRKILTCGDSEKIAWNNIMEKHKDDKLLENIDILFAPHHGRKSGGNDTFLDMLKPKVTFFGNAPCEHLGYNKGKYKGLTKFTNNQMGSVVIVEDGKKLVIYGTNQTFVDDWRTDNNLDKTDTTKAINRGGKVLYRLGYIE